MTPLQAESHYDWLERKILKKAYQLCYEALQHVEYLRDIRPGDEDITIIVEWDSTGMIEALANEILLIRDIMNEGE